MEEVGGNFDGSRYKNEIMWCIVLASYTHLENPQKRERNPLGKKEVATSTTTNTITGLRV